MNPDFIICTVASNEYLPEVEKLIASAKIHMPNQLIHIVLVNVDELKAIYLKELNENIVIEYDYIEFKNHVDKRGWCTNRRALLFPKLMKKYTHPIIWVDADSIFINSSEELLDYSKKYDLSVDYTHNHRSLTARSKQLQNLPKGPLGSPYYGVFNNSVIMTNNSSAAKEMFIYFSRLIDKYRLLWYADQEGLYLTYKEFEKKVNFLALDRKFCSRYYDENAVIWTAKGSIKQNEQYIKLGEQYIVEVRKWPMKAPPKKNKTKAANEHYSLLPRVINRFRKTIKYLFIGGI